MATRDKIAALLNDLDENTTAAETNAARVDEPKTAPVVASSTPEPEKKTRRAKKSEDEGDDEERTPKNRATIQRDRHGRLCIQKTGMKWVLRHNKKAGSYEVIDVATFDLVTEAESQGEALWLALEEMGILNAE